VPAPAVSVDGNIARLTIAGEGESPDVAVPTDFVPLATEPYFEPEPSIPPVLEPTATFAEPTEEPPTATPRPQRTPVPPTSTSPPPTGTVTSP
jgi:hypothetical protein